MPKSSLSDKIEKKSSLGSKKLKIDLKIHSPFSKGYFGIGGIDMAPAIVSVAKVKGLDVIGVTDFYTGSFVDELQVAAHDTPLKIIAGVDIRCTLGDCKDLLLSVFFPDGSSGGTIDSFLKSLDVPNHASGDKEYLISRSFIEIMDAVKEFNAVALPSRVDLTPQRWKAVPILVEEHGFRCFDLAFPNSSETFQARWPEEKFRFFSFSNAHSLAQIGTRTETVALENNDFSSIRELVTTA